MAWERKKASEHPRCQKKSGGRLEKGLANLWSRKKITKKSTPVVGQNPNGKCRIRCDPRRLLFSGPILRFQIHPQKRGYNWVPEVAEFDDMR
jgi:hypothetical protein